MGAFSFTDQELANKVIDAAHLAWESGRHHFVHDVSARGAKNDLNNVVALVIDGAVEVGWRLHSLTPYMNTLLGNNKEVLVTFERPT